VKTRLRRLAATALATTAALAAGAPAASGAELLEDRVSVPRAVDDSCFAGLRSGPGVVRRDFEAPTVGVLTTRLEAAGGDWDVAVFPRDGGDPVAGGASSGSHEVAGGYAFSGERLTVQACRRSGSADSAALTVSLDPIDMSGKPETVSLVDVLTPTRADKDRLTGLGLDLTEHGTAQTVGVILHGADDAATLKRNGFVYRTTVADLNAASRRDRQADARFDARASRSAFPSGRTAYRRIFDYENEIKELAKQNPGLVKLITLPNKTWEGRAVEGLEITTNPNARDGKPVFLQMGLHHAREWPSGEHALEWAYELINGYKAGDPRARRLVESTRTIVVPVVNPDGFNASREQGQLNGASDGRGSPNPGQEDELVNILANPQEYRRKNCRNPDDSEGGVCTPGAGLAENGVDPNRNYGGFWGGTGASGDRTNLTYFGPSPFSEPETRNVRDVVSKRHVVTLITNHTFSNLVLRPPGLQIKGDTPDEAIYAELGKQMTDENGYQNLQSFQLYDTTGTTEDWSYYATGGLGYTYEIGCLEFGDSPGDCKVGHFHPPFAEIVKEWNGETAFADADGRDGRGNREAYYKAQEHTADASKHAVVSGSAPAGAVLRLSKEFDTPTSQKNGDGSVRTFRDRLDTTLDVPSSGRFEWHVNPSTRPLVAKERGRQPTAPPSPPQSFSGDPSGPPSDGAAPCGDANTTMASCYNEHPFTVPTTGDNATATVRAEWNEVLSDWDMKLYRDVDGSGTVSSGDTVVGTSEQGTTDFEQVTIAEPVLQAGAKYVVRMTNFAAGSPYEGEIKFGGPDFQAAQKESWTLTCESPEGTVVTSQQVTIDRGQAQQLDLGGCARQVGGSQPGSGNQPGGQNEPRGDKREKPKVSQSLRITYDGRFYRARIRGRLRNTANRGKVNAAGSAGTPAQRCAGTVSISIKAKRKLVTLRRTKVRSNCRFARTLKFSKRRVPRKMRARGRKLKLRAVSRYNGNKFLLPAKRIQSARVKRKR
jgi:hypothetical protein